LGRAIGGIYSHFTVFMMQKSLCESYDVQSLNDNEIGLEVDLSQMYRALKAAQTSDVEMKLKKIQQQPYLSFTITSHVCPLLLFDILICLGCTACDCCTGYPSDCVNRHASARISRTESSRSGGRIRVFALLLQMQ